MKSESVSCSVVSSSVTPWTVARQAPLCMEFCRQEYWSGLPFLSPGESSQSKNQRPLSSAVKGSPAWDFAGGPVVKTPSFQYEEHGFSPWWGN